MDEYLNSTIEWFESLGITPDLNKLKRQISIITNFFKHRGVGVASCVTGFGKTYIAIICIHRLNLKFPEKTTNVIVPSEKLYDDWRGHIERFGLKNVTVYIVNTYTRNYLLNKVKHQCDFLVVDEVHRVLSSRGKLFNKTIEGTQFDLFLGLTATLSEEEEEILEKINIPIVDRVTMSEARRFGYVSDYVIYNLGITLPEDLRAVYDKYNDTYNSADAKFQYFVDFDKNLALIRACSAANDKRTFIEISRTADKTYDDLQNWKTGKEWREWYAQKMDWDVHDKEHPWSPSKIASYAHQWNWGLQGRKSFIYNSHDKIKTTREIIRKFSIPTITFAETINFVDLLVADLTLFEIKAVAYHSNIKGGIIPISVTKRFKNHRSAKIFRAKNNGIQYTDLDTGESVVEYFKEKKIIGTKLRKAIIKDFENGQYQVLCTAKALDEGFNVEGIELAIICSATSKQRNTIQRNGRALRFRPGKKAIIVNLYLKDTQDERWLRKRQKGEPGIRWITDISEIQ